MSLHVRLSGTGRPLVLLHGWGFTGAVWDDLVPALKRYGAVHSVDLPGHGRSTVPATGLSLANIAEALQADTPADAVWVGWSLGGQVLLELTRRTPNHVRAAVLVACTPRFTRAADWPYGLDQGTLSQFARSLSRAPAETLIQFASLCALSGDNARHTIRYLKCRTTPRGHAGHAALDAGLRILAGADLRPALAALRCPALLITGRHDPLMRPAAARAMLDLRPGLHHAEIEGASHAPFVSNPEQFLDTLDTFLRDLDAS